MQELIAIVIAIDIFLLFRSFTETIPIIKDVIQVEPAKSDEDQNDEEQGKSAASPNLLSVPMIDQDEDKILERSSVEEVVKSKDDFFYQTSFL